MGQTDRKHSLSNASVELVRPSNGTVFVYHYRFSITLRVAQGLPLCQPWQILPGGAKSFKPQ